MGVPRFFANDVDPSSGAVVLSPDESHHAQHVLRLGAGADVRVFDGEGREWAGRVSWVRRASVSIDLTGSVTPIAEPAVRVTIAIGILKGDQMDAVVRDSTVLGARTIVPLETAHLAAGKRRPRLSGGHWRRVAIASAKQCGRAIVPLIEAPASLPELLARDGFGVSVMLIEPSAGHAPVPSLAEVAGTRPDAAVVLIGPEGGWSSAEMALALGQGARLASLGPRTLRAEATPAVALSVLWTLWGW